MLLMESEMIEVAVLTEEVEGIVEGAEDLEEEMEAEVMGMITIIHPLFQVSPKSQI